MFVAVIQFNQARVDITRSVVAVDQRVKVCCQRVQTTPDAGNAATIIDIRFWAIIEGVNIRATFDDPGIEFLKSACGSISELKESS